MMINMRELGTRGNAIEFQEQMDLTEVLSGVPEVVKAEPLSVSLTARSESGLIEVSGTLGTEIEWVCSKCLKHYSERFDIPFHESFSPKTNEYTEEEAQDDDDDDDQIHFVSDNNVDLDPYIKESFLLELPYIPVCDPDCKGLCAVCGSNRNDVDCSCVEEKVDPRLAGLKLLFSDENK